MRRQSIYKKTVLKSGLRVITEKIQDVRSIAFGVWIDVGSRDEQSDENGLTHFIEHMLFKGTKNRTAQKIASSLESLGGSLNAFTSREQTCFHALVLDDHLEDAVDVISDILTSSTITPTNIEREKLVIIEEIREVNDTPSDHIHEIFSNCFWRDQPMGWPIMGTEEKVHKFNRRKVKNYMDRHYCAENIVVAAAGNVSHRKLVELIKGKLDFPKGNGDRGGPVKDPGEFKLETFNNGSNQTHLCLGFPGVSYNDYKEKYALLILHSYLGGGMSSVLFQKIREQKGMAYTIYTFPDFYRDCGVFGAYMATDKRFIKDSVETILREFKRLQKSKMSKAVLDRLKEQSKGQLLLGMESTNSRMNRIARQEIMASKYIPHLESIRLISKIKAVDILEVARKIFDLQKMTITTLGSASQKDFEKVNWSLL